MHEEATRVVAPETVVAQNSDCTRSEGVPSGLAADLSKSARTKQKKVLASLLEHWSGLTLFVEPPEVPMGTSSSCRSNRLLVNPFWFPRYSAGATVSSSTCVFACASCYQVPPTERSNHHSRYSVSVGGPPSGEASSSI